MTPAPGKAEEGKLFRDPSSWRGSSLRKALTSQPLGGSSTQSRILNDGPQTFMDLFHAVTQSIDQVLTCHWLEDFQSLKMDNGKSKTMDTEPGGEQTQYESIKTQNVAPEKQSGQLGAGMSTTESASSAFEGGESEKTADNIRYGQNISESGMGGMTNSTGTANQNSTTESNAGRASQRYGPGNDVGA